MTEFEQSMVARIASLEGLVIGTMALLFSMTGNDPDQSKQKALLQALQLDFESGLGHLPPSIQTEAKAHMSDLVGRVVLRASELREPNQRKH